MTKEPDSSDPSDPSGPSSGAAPEAPPRQGELEALFRRNFKKVYYLFVRFRVEEEEARDLAQETFLRAHRGWAGYRGEASESTWLFEIARNVFKNYIRDRNALKKRGQEIPLGATTDEEGGPPELELADPDPLPLDRLLKAERKHLLLEAIEKLPSQRRQCVTLRLRGLQYNEIAVLMALSIETVKSHLYQAREALRQHLAAGG